MSEENNEVQLDSPEHQESQQNEERKEEIIPVEWETVRETFEMRQEHLRIEEYFSRFLLNTEKQKAELLSRISMVENHVYELAGQIRDELNIDKDSSYELKMPESAGEKAYFVRKQ